MRTDTVFKIDNVEHQLVPVGERIFVLRDEETQTAGGIILPEKHNTLWGTIIACGHTCRFSAVGDRVMFQRFGHKEINEDLPSNLKYEFDGVIVMVEEDIAAFITKKIKVKKEIIRKVKAKKKPKPKPKSAAPAGREE